MDFKEFCKKNLMEFFIIVTGITVAMAVLGLSFYPEAKIGYGAFLSPIVFGMVSILPSFLLYSRKELTFRQMLIRRILHFAALELVLTVFGMIFHIFESADVIISFLLSVFAVYLFTNVIQYIISSKTAIRINEGLKKLQG
jgi:hypothetical protein